MTGKVDTAISRLFSSAKSLNTVSDQITVQIKTLEAALVTNGIGVEAWIEADRWTNDSDDFNVEYVAQIGYGKHNGKWGLLYSVWCEATENCEVSFLRDTARDIRIGALQKVPELLEKLADETEKLIHKATKNLADAKSIASALNTNGRK